MACGAFSGQAIFLSQHASQPTVGCCRPCPDCLASYPFQTRTTPNSQPHSNLWSGLPHLKHPLPTCFPQIQVDFFPIVVLSYRWLAWDDRTLQSSPLALSVRPAVERTGERLDPVETPSLSPEFVSTLAARWKSFVYFLIHFNSTLVNFSKGTSLRLYKAKWLLQPTCWETFSVVPLSIQRYLAACFQKNHLPFSHSASFPSASSLSFLLTWVLLLSQNMPLPLIGGEERRM